MNIVGRERERNEKILFFLFLKNDATMMLNEKWNCYVCLSLCDVRWERFNGFYEMRQLDEIHFKHPLILSRDDKKY